MALIIKQCECGRDFEALSKNRLYCPECRKERTRQQHAEAKKRYLLTEKGRKKHNEATRRTYYRHHEERRERANRYAKEHRDKINAYLRRKRKEEGYRCIHCKEIFERQTTERLCQTCQKIQTEKQAKLRRDRGERLRQQQKRAANRPIEPKKAISTTPPKRLPTEQDKLAMLRAVLQRHRAAA